MKTARIWTDDEIVQVNLSNPSELEYAMRFKAEHIKAKADPELFQAVADSLMDFNTLLRLEFVRDLIRNEASE